MKRIIEKGSFILLLMVFAVTTHAQKFGYVNSQGLLADMSEVKEMQSNLEALQKQLQKQGQTMVTDYQAQEQEAMKKKERGEMSPKEEETILQNLQTKQQELMTFEKEMQQKLVEKEQSLLQPIIDKVNAAIKSVATEGSYQFIFDTSTGVLLYADENQDVTTQVKAKLGL